jgi:hypothetical protein
MAKLAAIVPINKNRRRAIPIFFTRHNKYITRGETMKSCMSSAKYHVCSIHCSGIGDRNIYKEYRKYQYNYH